MIRRASPVKRTRICDELMLPSPQRIQRLTAEIQQSWTPAQRARRAGQASRVQLMVVAALDLRESTSDESY